MSARLPCFVLLLALVPGLAWCQGTSLRGRFMDPVSRAPVAGVLVKLTSAADSSDVRRATARDDGSFEVTGLGVRSYRLEATRLGYLPLKMIVRVTRAGQDQGMLALTPTSIDVPGVSVTTSPAPAIQKADTTEFRASAVKTHKDATAEDLVQKLPGVTLENGQVKAQGEAVQQVLVNGRPFFGSDPTAAMRNLPAEVIDRIQVYDRQSDQAEFSGFDDGQSQKAMNFILRDQKAQFGKVSAGYGENDRYQAGGNATLVRGPTRLTLLGLSNNINQRNFSPQDLVGALGGGGGGGMPRMMMMGGGGGFRPGGGSGGGGMQIMRMGGFGGGAFDPSNFFVGQQSGISTTHSGGLNAAWQWGSRLAATSSVFLNDTFNDSRQTLAREYLPAQDSIAFYDQGAISDSRNGNQRFDARFEWTPDSLNSVILQPRLYFQHNVTASSGDARNTAQTGAVLGQSVSESQANTDGANLSSRLTLRHRFAKRGRNVSAEINAGRNVRDGDNAQRAWTDTFTGATTHSDTLDHVTTSRTTTRSFSSRMAFTEPLRKGLQLQLIVHPSATWSDADATANRYDPVTATYSRPDTGLTNQFENRSSAHTAGLSLLFTTGPWKLLTNGSIQRATLRSEQTFPLNRVIERTYDDVLPMATLTGSFAGRRNFRLAYNTSTNAPSIAQLQNLVNSANPLSLTTGNPALRPTYTNMVSLRLSEANPMASTSRFVFLNASRTSHTIANATFTAPFDTTIEGTFLARGTQLTRPVNLDASWNVNAFGVASRPAKFLKSIVSVNTGGTFTRTPTLLNGRRNVATNTAMRAGATLSSNISAKLDFTLSYQGAYNLARNTLTTGSAGDYYSHAIGLRFNAIAGPGIVIRQEVNHNLQSGVADGFGQDAVLWTTTLGKKLLKGDSGELRITATDVLEQERSVSRSISETYVQDSRDLVLGRYVQAVFTYSFK